MASISFGARNAFTCDTPSMANQPERATPAAPPDAMKIGQRIKQLRKLMNVRSQQQFAQMLSDASGVPVTRGAVANWEKGDGIKLANLQQIALMTDCSFEWLSVGRGTPYPARGIDHELSLLPLEDQEELIPDIKFMVQRRLKKYKAQDDH